MSTLPNNRTIGLIGEDSSRFPYLSSFGRLYRLARLNGIWMGHVCKVLRTSPSIIAELRRGLVPWRQLDAWETSTWERTRLSFVTKWEDWHPYRPAAELYNSELRACLSCLAYGYHAMIHQLPWIESCPWHNEVLTRKCVCGRHLLEGASVAKSRLLACTCGVDHFDRNRGFLGMRQWPQNKVDRSISQYLSSATTSRGSLKLIADKEDPAGDFAYLIEQTRGNINGSPRARTAIPARMFTKESVNPTISREEVGCVLRGWCQSISGGRSTFPILGYYYKRIQQFVEHQVKSSGPFTPPIQEVCGVLSYYRSPLASEYASSMGCATVEDKALRLSGLGSILLQSVHKPFPLDSRFDRMAPLDEITLWAMRSSESSVLAMALSQLASLCVTDFIRAAFVRSGTLGKAPKVYSLLGRPVILVEQAPTFKIVVGYRLRKHIPFD